MIFELLVQHSYQLSARPDEIFRLNRCRPSPDDHPRIYFISGKPGPVEHFIAGMGRRRSAAVQKSLSLKLF